MPLSPSATQNFSPGKIMDLAYTVKQQAFREEIRQWLEANVPAQPLQSFDTAEGFALHRLWEAKLNEGRWGMVTWPEEFGGRGCDLVDWLIFEEEYYRARAPLRVNQNGIFLLGPTLMEYGTAEQKARILPKMACGEEVWAQGWSEPNAGSDMAAIRARADLRGDKYVINGQKIWSTRAVWADWLFGMFRTDPTSERHHGLTFILVPLATPGITVRPIPQLDGLPGFAEVFFDDVEVAVENRLGDEGAGWQVAMATAGFERGLMLRSPARFQETARRLVELYKANRASADGDPGVKDAVHTRLPRRRELLPRHLPDRLPPGPGRQDRRRVLHQQDLLVRAGPEHARHRHEHSGRPGRTAAPRAGCRGGGHVAGWLAVLPVRSDLRGHQ